MIQIMNKKMCSGCSSCANICPQKCIKMIADNEGFLYPVVDKEKCTHCGLCSKICPIINSAEDTLEKPECYACYNKNREEQINSSSGGVFCLIAKYILSLGGVVYGAAFDTSYNVKHIRIDSIDELDKIMRSKYVQSEINDSYQQVKKDLLSGVKVLFTGTPCQISGLKSFLMRDYNNLYTQDIICHGVPSQKAWERFLKENKIDLEATINFREKSDGWTNFCLVIKNDKKQLKQQHNKNFFMQSFLSNYNLRPSCYDCKFKTMHRDADITLADFWGGKNEHPKMDLIHGTSAVMIHSEKGKELFSAIKSDVVFENSTIDKIANFNTAYFTSVLEPKKREKFFTLLNKKSFKKAVKRCCRPSLYKVCLRKCKMIVKKIIRK